MPKFRIVSDVFCPPEWEFTDDKGQTVKLISSYFEVIEVGSDAPARKVFLHQKPTSDPLKEGDELDGKISDKQNKKGTHNKFERDKKFPDLVCPCGCKYTGPLDDFRPKREEAKPAPEAPAQTPLDTTDYSKDASDIPF